MVKQKPPLAYLYITNKNKYSKAPKSLCQKRTLRLKLVKTMFHIRKTQFEVLLNLVFVCFPYSTVKINDWYFLDKVR